MVPEDRLPMVAGLTTMLPTHNFPIRLAIIAISFRFRELYFEPGTPALAIECVYVGRITGGDRHHRYLGWLAASGCASCARGSAAYAVPEQSQADRFSTT